MYEKWRGAATERQRSARQLVGAGSPHIDNRRGDGFSTALVLFLFSPPLLVAHRRHVERSRTRRVCRGQGGRGHVHTGSCCTHGGLLQNRTGRVDKYGRAAVQQASRMALPSEEQRRAWGTILLAKAPDKRFVFVVLGRRLPLSFLSCFFLAGTKTRELAKSASQGSIKGRDGARAGCARRRGGGVKRETLETGRKKQHACLGFRRLASWPGVSRGPRRRCRPWSASALFLMPSDKADGLCWTDHRCLRKHNASAHEQDQQKGCGTARAWTR